MKISVKDLLVSIGVMMFCIGVSCLDSNLKVGMTISLIGVAIGFIGNKFFY